MVSLRLAAKSPLCRPIFASVPAPRHCPHRVAVPGSTARQDRLSILSQTDGNEDHINLGSCPPPCDPTDLLGNTVQSGLRGMKYFWKSFRNQQPSGFE